jgi:hypothetical protein
MPCNVKLWRDVFDGPSFIFEGEGWHNVQGVTTENPGRPYSFGYNRASSTEGVADQNCMMVGYTWNGGGWFHKGKTETGEVFMIPDGAYDLRSPKGLETSTWNDSIDGLRIQTVPSAGANETEFNINIPVQRPHNFYYPITIEDSNGRVKDDTGTLFDPCPGTTKKYFNSKPGVKCIYSKTDAKQVQNLHDAITGGAKSNQTEMLSHVKNEFCKNSENVWKNIGGGVTCYAHTTNTQMALDYCKVGSRIVTDRNCTAESTSCGVDGYATLAEAYCKANPTNAWCSCYNVTNNVCDTNATAAGCADKKRTFDTLVEKTPADQKASWSGMESCFGKVCVGNKYLPSGYNANCDRAVNICIQNFDVQGIADSTINAVCAIDSGSPSSVDDSKDNDNGPSAEDFVAADNLKKAEAELAAAEAAVAAGEPGAAGRLAAAQENLDTVENKGLTAYIPKSLDGLKTDQKQQIGAGVMGAIVIGCMMMMLLLLMGGGGGASARKRYR